MRIAVAGGTGVVGRYVAAAAEREGFEVLVISRSHGVDLRTGDGLPAALAGTDAIIDVTDSDAKDEEAATAFFLEATGQLTSTGRDAGVTHLVTLSIVGIDELGGGYYQAKLEQERAVQAAALPFTILRATQFHEFPAQTLGWNRSDGVARVPDLHVQTVAARSVADVLVELAGGPPLGRAPDLAGPGIAPLVELARSFAERFELDVVVQGDAPQVPIDALLAGDGARIEGPSFADWLESEDARAVAP